MESSHQPELYTKPYTYLFFEETIQRFWNFPGTEGELEHEGDVLSSIEEKFFKLIDSGNTLNLAYFLTLVEQAIANPGFQVCQTHFDVIIHSCVPHKNRSASEEEYYKTLHLFYFTWVPTLQKLVTCHKEKA